MPYGGGYSYLSSKNSKLNQCNFIKNSKQGAILIEFAFAVPVLFSLIYYLHDLHRLKQMQDRMKFVATEMAGILQNIPQNRENKAITITDIKYAAAAAYLSFFPGNTFYNTAANTSPLGYSSLGNIYCVKGLTDGKASVLWSKRWHSANRTYTPSSVDIGDRDPRSVVNLGTNVVPSNIYKDLKIREGEIKIIIETATHCGGYPYKLSNGKTVAQAGGRAKVFGFFIYPFQGNFVDSAGTSIAFNSVVVFTPKPGLFSEMPPE